MDRTILLNDKWFVYDGVKKPSSHIGIPGKRTEIPVNKDSSFTLKKKIVCPKQVNDTVTVYFEGDFKSIELYASGKRLPALPDREGKKVYDITPALKTGITVLTAAFGGGCVSGFFLSVKRNNNE